jgi:RAD51-like protein 2
MSGKPLLMEQVDRVAEMATAVSTHLSKISRSRKMDHKARELGVDFVAIAAAMTMNRFLEGINVYRVHDQIELLALIDQLPGILSLNSKIRIIIIDSIAFHFRQSLQDTAHRSRLLSSVSQQLNQLAISSILLLPPLAPSILVDPLEFGTGGGNEDDAA